MYTQKMHPATTFPDVSATLSTGKTVSLTNKEEGCDWKMVVVYRGKHCPICTKFLNKLEDYKGRLREVNIDVVAVSGDSKAQLDEHLEELSITYPIAYGLSQEDMAKLGLYISLRKRNRP